MRLIDADLIKSFDYSGLAYIATNDIQGLASYYKQLIDKQPTAYDVNKIVEQLYKIEQYYIYTITDLVRLAEVVAVVEGAVKDE